MGTNGRTTAEVVICGAGIAGVATAYFLAVKHGLNDVLLIDRQEPLALTTSKSGENYRNWWPNEVMVAFNNRSIALMEELAAESDNVFLMTHTGYVYATAEQAPDDVLIDVERVYGRLPVGGIRPHRSKGSYHITPPRPSEPHADGADLLLSQAVIREAFPHFSERVTAVVHARKGGAISVHQLGMYLLERAKAAGVRFLSAELVDVVCDGQEVSGVVVQTAEGRQEIGTRHLVNAAGPFMPRIAQMLGVDLPAYSVLQQKIAMQDPLGVVPREAPFTIFMDGQTLGWGEEELRELKDDPEWAWLVERLPGGLHVKPEGRGDSTWIKLGWAINQMGDEPIWSPAASEEFPDIVLRGASRLVPGLAQYIGRVPQPLVHYGGYYTKTAENMPLVGRLPVQGGYVVGALSGFGTMSACAAGELCAAWVTDGERPSYAWALAPERYMNPAYQSFVNEMQAHGEL